MTRAHRLCPTHWLILLLLLATWFLTMTTLPSFAHAGALRRREEASSLTLSSLTSSTRRYGTTPSHRDLGDPNIATSRCDRIRVAPFKAQLELKYFYILEIVDGGRLDVEGARQAISHALVAALSDCDHQGIAKYGIDFATEHQLSNNGFCIPLDPFNNCHVILGSSKISLDDEPGYVKERAYDAIKGALADTAYMRSFSADIRSGDFIRSLSDTLVLAPSDADAVKNDSRSTAATLAVFAATIAFVLVAIFAYGILRRYKRRLENQQNESNEGQGLSPAPLGIKRMQCLETLKDDDPAMFHLAFDSDEPCITWSVSDITSDSGSARSALSRCNSPLEKIDEEPDEEETPRANRKRDRDASSQNNQNSIEGPRICHDQVTPEASIASKAVTPENEHAEPMISILELDSSREERIQEHANFVISPINRNSCCEIEVITVTSDEESDEHSCTGGAFEFDDLSLLDWDEDRRGDDDSSSLDLSSYTTESDSSLETWLMKFLFELSRSVHTRRIEN